jgi:membrane peptidoglycan carboxypeptidase
MYGVEEASMTFFGKPARDVSLAQAAYLASLPQAPTFYSPYGNNREALDGRKDYVLDRMLELGFATSAEVDDAKAEKVVFLPPAASGIRAPHFVFYVREQLENEFGREALLENGWRVITTLDADLQAKAEEIVKRKALENEKKFKASNAALVAMVPQTGDIVAMVGSRDYFDTTIDGAVNVALSLRQPGSSFKPFVYAAAFEEGYAPETVTFDSPTQFSTLCPVDSTSDEPPCYYPGNYDEKFRGPMSFRDALAQSINIVAIKALYLVGIQDALRVARAMGITTLNDPDRYGLTLVLGGGEVKLLEMVGAYGVFANEGVKNTPRGILKIEDRSGALIKEYTQTPEEVLPQEIALSISDVLSDNTARAPEFGINSALQIPGHHIAAKTGTTNDFRDTWILGYSSNLVVGAWAGNNDNTPMEKKIAGFIVAPIWNEFFVDALETYPDAPFPEPPTLTNEASRPIIRGIWQGFDPVKVDAFTGAPVPENYGGLTKYRVTTNVHDILHSVSRADPTGPFPENPATDPQYLRWEYGARAWAARSGYVDGHPVYIQTP